MLIRPFALGWGLWAAAGLAAQQDPPATAKPPAAAAAPAPAPAAAPAVPAKVRAALQEATAKLLVADHAFRGTTAIRPGPGMPLPTAAPPPFAGSWHGAVQWFQMGKHERLRHGTREIERQGDGPWTLPQGEAPDCPLSPRGLALHLPAAELRAATPGAHRDRPAMLVQARWPMAAAGRLLDTLAVPETRSQAILEKLVQLTTSPEPRLAVDALLVFDPAQREFYAMTLRVVLVGPDGDRPPLPDELPGLPPPPAGAELAFDFHVEVQPAASAPLPALPAAAREQLLLPAK